jgi:restriction endonuclease S subunit
MAPSSTHIPPFPIHARLGGIARIFAGFGVSREEMMERPEKKLPVIGVRDMDDGRVASCSALDRVGFADLARAKNYAVELGDVLLTGRGTILKFGLVGSETVGAVASANIIVIRPSAAVVGGALYAILSSDVFRPKIELLRRGSTKLLSLSPKDLAKLELDLPPFDEQHRIAALVVEAQTAYRTSLEAAELRRSLARTLINERLFGHN